MNTEHERLTRLVALARRGRPAVDEGPATPPPGFAPRMAAHWAGSTRALSTVDAWERVSWWGSGLAAAACLFVLAFHQPSPEPSGFDLLLGATADQQTF